MNHRVHAHAENAGQRGVLANVLVGNQLLAGDNGPFSGHGDIHVVELVALDNAGPVGRGLLHMDDGAVQLGHRYGDHLFAGVEGIVHVNELVIVHGVHFFPLLAADAPVFRQSGAVHQAHGQKGQPQRGGVELKHQDVLRVVLKGQLALLDGGAKATRDVGIAGVGGIAVDIRLHAALADHHIPVAARRTAPGGEILLPLAQDFIHGGIGLAVGGKTAKADGVSALHVPGYGFGERANFSHYDCLHILIVFLSE
ncbi:hypothetical protein SDC9_156028 [bioreactor metagenome]|uniref:Uncharacterized protein n=1 Tax=bioreactor metagenome TaxID=1076179 RepID=A0A645F8D6_9ZZZZ